MDRHSKAYKRQNKKAIKKNKNISQKAYIFSLIVHYINIFMLAQNAYAPLPELNMFSSSAWILHFSGGQHNRVLK